jgi:hypothetical protein
MVSNAIRHKFGYPEAFKLSRRLIEEDDPYTFPKAEINLDELAVLSPMFN